MGKDLKNSMSSIEIEQMMLFQNIFRNFFFIFPWEDHAPTQHMFHKMRIQFALVFKELKTF